MTKADFPDYLTSFFSQYLKLQRGLSDNSIASYSDAFLLFFRYCKDLHGIHPDQISFESINRDLVFGYCQWLEDGKKSSVKTRNLRLTAMHSFFRYVQMQMPEQSALCRDILNIPMKKCDRKPPSCLSDLEVKMLFGEPDTHSREGIRDLAILAVLYDSGARVSELTNLKIEDVSLSRTATIKITGKGRKMRLIPVSAETTGVIKAYYKSNQIDLSKGGRYLFPNKKGETLTRPGVNYILDKYVKLARQHNPGLFSINVTAHVMRHTKATNLLLSEISLIYIRDFLGHSSVVTTENYAKTNPEFLRKAIEKNSKNYMEGLTNYSELEKENLTEFLKAFRI
jgi:site-specific recombinase XerD